MKFVLTLIVIAAATPAFAQYGGPAILARGESPAAMSTAQIDFRPFASVSASYNTGLGGVSVDASGKQVNTDSTGVSIAVGVSGLHSWRHTKVGLNWSTSFSHYTQASFFDSTGQNLLLGVTQQLSRHATFSWNNAASLTGSNLASPTLPSTVQFDPSTANLPSNEFFDNRTLTLNSQGALSVQRSTRLSLSIGGGAFMTRRRSTALYGVTGETASGDLQYRMTRRSTVGAMYSFSHYSFTGIFSSTDAHTVAGVYSVQISRTSEFSGSAGITRYETKFVQSVPIDPAVAALIGVSTGLRVSYQTNTIPYFNGRISRTLPKGTLFASSSYGLMPGNGLFLTSTALTIQGGYGYTGLRKWSIAAGGGYNRSRSVGNVLGLYGSYSANVSISRQVAPITHGTLGFSLRKYDSGDFKNYNKWSCAVNAGLAFSPGNVPLRLW